MRHRTFELTARGLGVLLAASFTACVDSGSGDSRPQNPMAIAVAPEDFLGAVPCSSGPGSMQRYVVTLFDVTTDESFTLPSSGPSACTRATSFGFVVPGHRYVASVDGYDRTDVFPLGSANSGSPVMVDGTGQFVPPRWQTTCSGSAAVPDDPQTGDATTPDAATADAATVDGGGVPANCANPDPLAGRNTAVTAVLYVTRRVATCRPLCNRGGPSETGLAVSIDQALGDLRCGNGPGQVATFRVARSGNSELPRSAGCGQVVSFTSVAPGSFSTFAVTAFEQGKAEPTWDTQCSGKAIAGTVSPVNCDLLAPITPQGDF